MYDDGAIRIEKDDQCYNCRFNGDHPAEKFCPKLEALGMDVLWIAPDLEGDHYIVSNCDFYERMERRLNIVKMDKSKGE